MVGRGIFRLGWSIFRWYVRFLETLSLIFQGSIFHWTMELWEEEYASIFSSKERCRESISHLFCTLKNGILWLNPKPWNAIRYLRYQSCGRNELSFVFFLGSPCNMEIMTVTNRGASQRGSVQFLQKRQAKTIQAKALGIPSISYPWNEDHSLGLTASLPPKNGGWKVSSLFGVFGLYSGAFAVSFGRIKFLQLPHGANDSWSRSMRFF